MSSNTPESASTRRRSFRPHMISITTFMTLMIMLLFTTRPTCAQVMELDAGIYESRFYQELALRGEIYVDRRQPPSRQGLNLERRQIGDTVVPTTVASTSTSTSPTSTSSSHHSTITSANTLAANSEISTETEKQSATLGVSTSTAPTVTVITTPLPTPFDTSLGSNFTSSSCPSFFSTFLANGTFQSCVPVSLLLQNSNSFFRAQRSFTLLTQTLDSACSSSLAICSPLMAKLASELLQDANCGQDYRQQNPLVLQAYNGLVAYEPVYRATCLKSSDTGDYCFTDASTNSSNSADFYPYYTAVGLSLPTTANPTCSQCLKDLMGIFAGYATSTIQPLSRTYLGSAQQVDKGCGSGFVSTDVKVGSVSANAAGRSLLPCLWTVVLVLVGVSFLGI